MKRTCKICKKNNEQKYNACGYIPKSERRQVFVDFPLYNEPEFGVDICPVWFYNTYEYIYKIFNLLKAGANVIQYNWHYRFLYATIENYKGLKAEDEYNKRGK